MHTNTHQGTEDNCYGLDHSSNIQQLIGKGAHSHEFLYFDFCLTPVVVWLLETKWIEIASEIPWKRLGQGISAFFIPRHYDHIYGLSELTVPLLAPVHTGMPEKHQQPTPDSHVKQMLQTEQCTGNWNLKGNQSTNLNCSLAQASNQPKQAAGSRVGN